MEVIAFPSSTASDRKVAGSAHRRRVADAALIAIFLAGLCAPLIGVQWGTHGWDIAQQGENRRLAPKPQLLRGEPLSTNGKLKAIAKFPGEFKYYLSDHFGFRNLLIRLHGMIMVKGLGATANPAVIVGKDGWLYLGNDHSLEDWRNTDPFTPAELQGWREMLEARQQFCAARGIPYLFVLAPAKHDIYPEYMPDRLTRVGTMSRSDQLLTYLHQTRSPVRVLDLREPLLAAKRQGFRLYHKTDTHWNGRGAWVAYESIMDAVHQQVPAAQALPSSSFEPVTVMKPGLDLAGMLGLKDAFREESLEFEPRDPTPLRYTPQDNLEGITLDAVSNSTGKPRIVMFRDSFMTPLLPYVTQSFSRGVYLWEDGFDPQVVEAEHPDIVIQELAERKLFRPLELLEQPDKVDRVNGKWKLENPVH